jgi:ketopantoate hydroxymethyltransferase
VTDDMLGLSGFYPRFVKKFAKLNNIIEKGVQKYNKAVLNRKFPGKKNIF